ncbi:MAG: metal ABC transporter permease [Endomicrobiales bacterium]|nr:metal ABC transporter permease [Endomicrobiales bacterium]
MIEMFGYEFIWRAAAASVFGGIACGIIGVWVILLNIPFVGIAMSHSGFAGAVFGLLFGLNPLACAVVFCIITALAIGPVADRGDVSVNVSIGIIFSFVLGLAFLGIGLLKGPKTEALNFLWGSILAVSYPQIALLAICAAGILVFLGIFHRETMAVLFSREVAKAAGIPERLILYALLFICGIAVTLNLNTIGGLLIFSLITSAPLAAYQLTYKMKTMYFLSALFAVVSCLAGLFISYLINVPSGAVIVIVSSAIFGVCLLFSPKRRMKKMNRKQFFDMHAHKWDSYVTKEVVKRIEKDVIPALKVKKGESILDVGCGTGILLTYLRKAAGSESRITALDYSKPMIDKAREKHGAGFKYICADAGRTGLKGESFDLAVCFSVFPHFPDKLRVMREMFRVLRSGGRLIVAHADTKETINAHHHGVGGPVAHDIMPGNDEMIALLQKAGFKNSKIQEDQNCYLVYSYK